MYDVLVVVVYIPVADFIIIIVLAIIVIGVH